MRITLSMLSAALVIGTIAGPVPAQGRAQQIPVADRVNWEEARLAFEEGDRAEALVLIQEVLDVTGPVPAILLDAAAMAFETRDYLKAERFVLEALETADAEFAGTPAYDDGIRLAARIQRALRPLRESLSGATPLPLSDPLARAGFAVAMRDRNSICEWKFERDGLLAKTKDNARCANGDASSSGRVRVEVTIAQRGGGSRSAAGLAFGWQDERNHYRLNVHPRWEERGDMSLVHLVDGVEAEVQSAMVVDAANRSLRRWSEKGPWRLGLELRGRRIDWYLNGEHVGTAYADREVRGGVRTAAGGPDDGEFLFTDLGIETISLLEGAAR